MAGITTAAKSDGWRSGGFDPSSNAKREVKNLPLFVFDDAFLLLLFPIDVGRAAVELVGIFRDRIESRGFLRHEDLVPLGLRMCATARRDFVYELWIFARRFFWWFGIGGFAAR